MKFFTMSELTATKTGCNNTPNDSQVQNLERLCTLLLDPVRELYGAPIMVSSGFRSPEVNKKVGGVSCSQHLQGLAADIQGGSKVKTLEILEAVINFFFFDQCIYYEGKGFVHVSIADKGSYPRRQVIIQ